MSSSGRRLLLVAYQFPPVGGAGVQRVAKMTRYLPEFGWDVSVLTVSNPSVPLEDRSLVEEIPPATVIRRARSWEPGYRWKRALTDGVQREAPVARWRAKLKRGVHALATLALQPDPQILWAPDAIRQGLRLLREMPHHAILVSAPPFSSFLTAAALSRRSGLPLLLDYRDEWSISSRYWENLSAHPVAQWIQRRMQRGVLGHADSVIATTRHSARALAREVQAIGRNIPVKCLYNGIDPVDLRPAKEVPHPRTEQRFRLSHVGTLWTLTSARALLSAVEQLSSSRPDLAARLEIEMVGRCTSAEAGLLERFRQLPCRLLRRDYIDHQSAVRVMCDTDQLCLLLSDVPGAERVVPGKTFEYLATGRPILGIMPEGETSELLRSHAGVTIFSPQDVTGICQHLADRLSSCVPTTPYSRDVSRYGRRQQAEQLAGWLDAIMLPGPEPAKWPSAPAMETP